MTYFHSIYMSAGFRRNLVGKTVPQCIAYVRFVGRLVIIFQ